MSTACPKINGIKGEKARSDTPTGLCLRASTPTSRTARWLTRCRGSQAQCCTLTRLTSRMRCPRCWKPVALRGMTSALGGGGTRGMTTAKASPREALPRATIAAATPLQITPRSWNASGAACPRLQLRRRNGARSTGDGAHLARAQGRCASSVAVKPCSQSHTA